MCAPVVQGYGLTETCAASFIGVPDDAVRTAAAPKRARRRPAPLGDTPAASMQRMLDCQRAASGAACIWVACKEKCECSMLVQSVLACGNTKESSRLLGVQLMEVPLALQFRLKGIRKPRVCFTVPELLSDACLVTSGAARRRA
jgi:hypothetical protein